MKLLELAGKFAGSVVALLTLGTTGCVFIDEPRAYYGPLPADDLTACCGQQNEPGFQECAAAYRAHNNQCATTKYGPRVADVDEELTNCCGDPENIRYEDCAKRYRENDNQCVTTKYGPLIPINPEPEA